MARLVGFIVGVALIVGGLYHVKKPPQDLPLMQSTEPQAAPHVTNNAPAQSVAMLSPISTEARLPEAEAVGHFEEDLALDEPVVALITPLSLPESIAAEFAEALPLEVEPPDSVEIIQWQTIWQAFGARRSAQGFAATLEDLTGLDYRVDKLAPGRYQVAFSYRDDDERLQALGRIEQATGLVLAQGGDDAG